LKKEIGYRYFENTISRHAGYRVTFSKAGLEYVVEREYGKIGHLHPCHLDPAYKGRNYEGAINRFEYESNDRLTSGYKLVKEKKCPKKIIAKFKNQKINVTKYIIKQKKENQWQDNFENEYPEGAEKRFIQSMRERNSRLRRNAKLRYGITCMVCGFSFDKCYGKTMGESYIEVHHTKPLAEAKKIQKTSIEDVIVICSNCHRVIHKRKGKLLDWKKLRKVTKKFKDWHS